MAPFDLVLLLVLSETVQNALIGEDKSLFGGLVSAAALIFVSRVVSYASWRSGAAERLFGGVPVILVRHGTVREQALAREQITRSELMEALRREGCASLSKVRYAILENDGTITVGLNKMCRERWWERIGGMKHGVLAAVLFALCATPAFAVGKGPHYGHLPIHARGMLQGWMAHEDVFHGRAGQRIKIEVHSARMRWLQISVTPLSARAPVFSFHGTQGRSGEVTLPHDGAYKVRVAIRPDGARIGHRVDFRVDITAASHLALKETSAKPLGK
jgi:hypothetical protein